MGLVLSLPHVGGPTTHKLLIIASLSLSHQYILELLAKSSLSMLVEVANVN